MTTITILGKAKKTQELIAIPRKEYEEFSRWKKMEAVKEFIPSTAEKKDLEQARKEYKAGEHISLEELEHELETVSKKKS